MSCFDIGVLLNGSTTLKISHSLIFSKLLVIFRFCAVMGVTVRHLIFEIFSEDSLKTQCIGLPQFVRVRLESEGTSASSLKDIAS